MQLTQISKVTGTIELQTGLHIGGGDNEMHIGGTDNPVIRNPVTHQPYIPGSSLKGKMRHLMEWRAGVVGATEGVPLAFKHLPKLEGQQRLAAQDILKLFGGAPQSDSDFEEIQQIGPTRLAFWDCNLQPDWLKAIEGRRSDLPLYTEVKAENMINRIKGVAEHPRHTERVPAGTRFSFNLTVKVHDDEDLLDKILMGLQLVELTGLGGSISRGYGKVCFQNLQRDDQDIQAHYKKALSKVFA